MWPAFGKCILRLDSVFYSFATIFACAGPHLRNGEFQLDALQGKNRATTFQEWADIINGKASATGMKTAITGAQVDNRISVMGRTVKETLALLKTQHKLKYVSGASTMDLLQQNPALKKDMQAKLPWITAYLKFFQDDPTLNLAAPASGGLTSLKRASGRAMVPSRKAVESQEVNALLTHAHQTTQQRVHRKQSRHDSATGEELAPAAGPSLQPSTGRGLHHMEAGVADDTAPNNGGCVEDVEEGAVSSPAVLNQDMTVRRNDRRSGGTARKTFGIPRLGRAVSKDLAHVVRTVTADNGSKQETMQVLERGVDVQVSNALGLHAYHAAMEKQGWMQMMLNPRFELMPDEVQQIAKDGLALSTERAKELEKRAEEARGLLRAVKRSRPEAMQETEKMVKATEEVILMDASE